mgnify:CR=1 FL=1
MIVSTLQGLQVAGYQSAKLLFLENDNLWTYRDLFPDVTAPFHCVHGLSYHIHQQENYVRLITRRKLVFHDKKKTSLVTNMYGQVSFI